MEKTFIQQSKIMQQPLFGVESPISGRFHIHSIMFPMKSQIIHII